MLQRECLNMGIDVERVIHIEQEWRNWLAASGKEPPRKPDLAFIRFCMSFHERRGAPA